MIIPLKFRQFISPSSRDLAEGIQMVIIFMDADSHFAVVEVYLAKGNVNVTDDLRNHCHHGIFAFITICFVAN
jgi:hypothetical protein